MIELSEMGDDKIGREVLYDDGHGKMEYGRITSWNQRFIFVRYHTRIDHEGILHPRTGETSEATRPEDLQWSFV